MKRIYLVTHRKINAGGNDTDKLICDTHIHTPGLKYIEAFILTWYGMNSLFTISCLPL